MLTAFIVIVSFNVLFVAWRMWVAHAHPRNPEGGEPVANTSPAYLESIKRSGH